MRPKIKICGVTTSADVEAVLAVGADYIGLNFYPRSPRFLEPDRAASLREQIGGRAKAVGVFVDCEPSVVESIDRRVGLDLLQFHGDEDPGEIAAFGERAIKVFHVVDRFDPSLLDAYPSAWGFLFDSAGGSGTGGTGAGWCWEAIADVATTKPIFVAGGIGPGNVVEVCSRCDPWGIDLCSGVESAPGRKDPALLQRLFEEIGHVEGEDAS